MLDLSRRLLVLLLSLSVQWATLGWAFGVCADPEPAAAETGVHSEHGSANHEPQHGTPQSEASCCAPELPGNSGGATGTPSCVLHAMCMAIMLPTSSERLDSVRTHGGDTPTQVAFALLTPPTAPEAPPPRA